MKLIDQRLLLTFVIASILALAGTGCSTTKGFGEDVEDLGEKIQGDD